MTAAYSLIKNVTFGAEPRLRVRMMRTVLAAALYAACLVAQWDFVRLGLAERGDAERITLLCAVGVSFFLIAIRSGLSMRFADAALTMPQIMYALVCLGVAYHSNPSVRSNLTLIVPLVLVFGAFILPARRCVQLGGFAVAVFGATIGYGSWTQPDVFPPLVELHAFCLIAVVVPALAHLAGQLSQLRIDQKIQARQLRDAMERLQRVATHDPLTDLPNRRHVDERMAGLIAGVRRNKLPLSLAILDLDRFKRVNDQFGHAAGDDVLRIFAREASSLLRQGDLLARWGGEEFLLVLPDTGLEDARAIVERMRTRVGRSANWTLSPHPPVTFSAGLAVLGADQTLQQALQCADSALYAAKDQGRDRIVADGEPATAPKKKVVPPARRFLDQLSNIF